MRREEGEIMNVIWIVADTFRKGDMGCYGNPDIHTPSLDALAAKSVRMDRHYEAGFPTMPTRADYFTGNLTGCFMGWQPFTFPLPGRQFLLAQVLRRAGFHTAGVVDTPFFIRNGMNYDFGFQSFIEIPGQDYWTRGKGSDERGLWQHEMDRFAPKTFIQASQWLERHYEDDFFLYIDTWDPHEPWDAPNYYTELYWPNYDGEVITPLYGHWQDVEGYTEEKVKKAHATYCGEVTMVDTWAGHFLRQVENMGLMENTAIIFTTDHGFYFGEHGGLFGKMTREKASTVPYYWDRDNRWTRSPLYEELIAIPLLIYVPGVSPGVSSSLNWAIDLMPTVLDLMGQEIPEQVAGQSLVPMLRDTDKKGREYVISAQPFALPTTRVRLVDDQERELGLHSDTTVTTDEWSLLYSPLPGESWLYHLPSDPKQENNVIDQNQDVAKDLHQYLARFMKDNSVPEDILKPYLELRL